MSDARHDVGLNRVPRACAILYICCKYCVVSCVESYLCFPQPMGRTPNSSMHDGIPTRFHNSTSDSLSSHRTIKSSIHKSPYHSSTHASDSYDSYDSYDSDASSSSSMSLDSSCCSEDEEVERNTLRNIRVGRLSADEASKLERLHGKLSVYGLP